MAPSHLLETLTQGVQNQRIPPQLAACIAAEVLGIAARSARYDNTIRLQDEPQFPIRGYRLVRDEPIDPPQRSEQAGGSPRRLEKSMESAANH